MRTAYYSFEGVEMSLADWQISLISASVGTAIPLVLVIVREMHLEKKRKQEVRNVLCSELLLAREALAESLKTGKLDEKDTNRLFVSAELPIHESFPLDTTFYDDIAIETLAKSVNMEALKNLQMSYNTIYRFNNKRLRVIGGFWTEKQTVTNLISNIEKTIRLITDC
jgi:hypothetical protein